MPGCREWTVQLNGKAESSHDLEVVGASCDVPYTWSCHVTVREGDAGNGSAMDLSTEHLLSSQLLPLI